MTLTGRGNTQEMLAAGREAEAAAAAEVGLVQMVLGPRL